MDQKGGLPLKQIGYLRPLSHEPTDPVTYYFNQLDQAKILLNELLGKSIRLTFLGEITCINCGRIIPKSYNSGACFTCYRDLPEHDLCIVKPELCHYHQGTCRDNQFGESHCMQSHIVYLSLSSDVKVGITRKGNMLKRWIDQGAVQAIPLLEVPSRKDAGEIEVHLAQFVKDKTNWRKMLKNEIAVQDLMEVRANLLPHIPASFQPYLIEHPPLHQFHYPQIATLEKINSLGLDKQPEITGKLIGIKAQYLILDTGVFQVKKHSGYKVSLEA